MHTQPNPFLPVGIKFCHFVLMLTLLLGKLLYFVIGSFIFFVFKFTNDLSAVAKYHSKLYVASCFQKGL